jgi:hypothetical protein
MKGTIIILLAILLAALIASAQSPAAVTPIQSEITAR